MSLLTPNASEAIDWLFKRIPDRHFDNFRDDMEDAMRAVLQKYGFDQALIDGFNVNKLVADRAPSMSSLKVTIYEGKNCYAQATSGRMFVKKNGEWTKSTMSLADVKAMSITAIPGIIKIRSDKL
ncbi:hypothetical protein KS527_004464 [Salmonella enterica]|nr:hypothetical protein [Salmonella enterica subsp. enterica]EHQ9605707.1 hypothetical protein [Salmonella enterica]